MAIRSIVFSFSIAVAAFTFTPTPQANAACDGLRLKSGEVRITLHFEVGKVFDGGRRILALVTDSSRRKLAGQQIMFTLPEGRQAAAHPGYRWSVYRDVIARAAGEQEGFPHFVLSHDRTLPRRTQDIPVAGFRPEPSALDATPPSHYFVHETDRIIGPDPQPGRLRHGEGRLYTDRPSGPDAEASDFAEHGQNEGFSFDRGTGGPL